MQTTPPEPSIEGDPALRLALGDRRTRGLLALVDLTRVLAAEIDLGRILTLIANEACRAMECERASLYLYDSERNELFTKFVTELEIDEIRTTLGKGITGWVAENRRSICIDAPASDPRWSPQFDEQTGFHTLNILAAPLVSVHDDRLVGVLQLLNKHDGPFDRFDQKLLEAFSSHAASALERARLIEESQAKRRLEVSLTVAHDIQVSFMPGELREVPGYDLAGWWEPAEEASGDYYDVLDFPDGRVGLVMADVAGHGIGPSLIMASMRAALHALVLEHSQSEDLLRLLSQTVLSDLHNGRFITCFCGALDYRYHYLRYANAGHGPALHYCAKTATFREIDATGLPLGVFTAAPPKTGPVIRIEPGDLIFLCTDGLVETMNAQRELFGHERLKRLVVRHHALPCRELVKRLGQAASEFRGDPHPIDDVTMLVVRRMPEK